MCCRSGYTVLTTCSPRNFDYVKSLGAVEAFNYNDPESPTKIRELTTNRLKLAWDTISEEGSAKFCAYALSTESGCKYGSILPVRSPRKDVESVDTLMYTVFGEPFTFGPSKILAVPEDFEYCKMFTTLTEKLLAEGKLRAHTPKVGKRGLQGVLQELDDMRAGKVSGNKWVYLVDETQSVNYEKVDSRLSNVPIRDRSQI